MTQTNLAVVPIPDGTLEHDLTLLERFQEFSAELLRISLVGLTAIGFGVSKTLFADSQGKCAPLPSDVKALALASLVLLALSAAAALANRYSAADSIAWHLQGVRRVLRATEIDQRSAAKDFRRRLLRFRIARTAIVLSALFLALGTFLLVGAIILAVA